MDAKVDVLAVMDEAFCACRAEYACHAAADDLAQARDAVAELIAATKIEREIRAHRTGWTTAERWSYAERLSMPSNSTRNAIEQRASENVAAALAAFRSTP